MDHAVQALAIDERRYEFRPEIWLERERVDQRLDQRWFAGVHSNVGGGYADDGLANLAFQWMRSHAEQDGLAIDGSFAAAYSGYAMDRLYRSDSLFYRLWDALPGRRGRGPRGLVGRPPTANLALDSSVIWRMQANPAEKDPRRPEQARFPDLGQPYRPANVIAYLASQPNPGDCLASLGVATALPEDVLSAISKDQED